MQICATVNSSLFARQDYLECLHHRKEIARMNTILKEAKKLDDAASGVILAHALNTRFLLPPPLHTRTPPFSHR